MKSQSFGRRRNGKKKKKKKVVPGARFCVYQIRDLGVCKVAKQSGSSSRFGTVSRPCVIPLLQLVYYYYFFSFLLRPHNGLI